MLLVKVLLVTVLVGTISARYTDTVQDTSSNSQGLVKREKKTDKTLCYFNGGTLISLYTILTTGDFLHFSDYKYQGISGYRELNTEDFKDAFLRTVYYKFDINKVYKNNIGLLIFQTSLLDATSSIALLPDADGKIHHNTVLYANGYSIIKGKNPDKRTESAVVVIERGILLKNGCAGKYKDKRVNKQSLCTVLQVQNSICGADHGGPIFQMTPEPKGDKATVVALAIRMGEEQCTADKPLVSISLAEKDMNKWLKSFHDI